ncbi:MAG: phytoene desaturase family protein, partial [Bradymonadaceae bacterium]
ARDQPGGRAGVFHRGGYTFDAGPTVITAPHLFDELFELVDRDPRDYYDLQPVDPFYRISFPDGTSFDYVGDEERLLAEIRSIHPPDVDNYLQLADHVREIFEVGYEELADQPFDRLSTMLRVVPQMIRLKSYRSVYSLVASYIESDKLRRVFTFQPLLVGGNPFDVTSIYLLIHHLERKWGVHFPEGGTTALVGALTDLLDDIGVDLQLETPVQRIEVEEGRARAIRTARGERMPARLVVSNADPCQTYGELVDSRHLSTNTEGRLDRVRQSMGLFVGYFGADRQYPDVEHHTIVLGERYESLLDDIFDQKTLAEDFSLYLHRPTATDPSLAPEGHDAFYVLSPVPNNHGDVDWQRRGAPYFDRILSHLEQRHLPGLSNHLTERLHVTPDYFEQELGSVAGAGFGPEPRLTQSAWFRFHNRSEDVDDLYLVGAGTHPGAGLPGVLNSAKILEEIVPAPETSARSRRRGRRTEERRDRRG